MDQIAEELVDVARLSGCIKPSPGLALTGPLNFYSVSVAVSAGVSLSVSQDLPPPTPCALSLFVESETDSTSAEPVPRLLRAEDAARAAKYASVTVCLTAASRWALLRERAPGRGRLGVDSGPTILMSWNGNEAARGRAENESETPSLLEAVRWCFPNQSVEIPSLCAFALWFRKRGPGADLKPFSFVTVLLGEMLGTDDHGDTRRRNGTGMKRPFSPAPALEKGPPERGAGDPPGGLEQRLKREKKHQTYTLCEVCNIQLNSAAQAQIHYNGKSHQKRLKQLNSGKPAGGQGRTHRSALWLAGEGYFPAVLLLRHINANYACFSICDPETEEFQHACVALCHPTRQ
ncbi:Z385B protein, partial [Atractosteus spatula]|nr:Z385B protein [Atractosteus spatula]